MARLTSPAACLTSWMTRRAANGSTTGRSSSTGWRVLPPEPSRRPHVAHEDKLFEQLDALCGRPQKANGNAPEFGTAAGTFPWFVKEPVAAGTQLPGELKAVPREPQLQLPEPDGLHAPCKAVFHDPAELVADESHRHPLSLESELLPASRRRCEPHDRTHSGSGRLREVSCQEILRQQPKGNPGLPASSGGFLRPP